MAAESTLTGYREDEEEDFRTPEFLIKKRKKKKQLTKETGETDEKEETMNIKVTQIPEKSGRISPIVAYFSSGYDPSLKTLEANDNDSDGNFPKVRVYRNMDETKSRRLQVVVSPTGSNVDFVGSNYSGEGATAKTCVYRLGILDKETQTLKIVPIDSDKIFRLEPKVRKSESVGKSEPSESIRRSDTAAEKKTKLNNLYGTKNAINRDKKLRESNLGDDLESQELFEGKLKDIEIKEDALKSTSSLVVRNIPPYEASATTPQEAYPLDKIILNREWDYLKDVYELLQQGTGASTDAYPAFVRNRIYKLRDIEDDDEKYLRSCVFSFLTHLVKFKDLNSMDGRQSVKNHWFPGIIRYRFKLLFEGEGAKFMPLEKINLLISYVLVLTLHVDEFKTDPEDIAKDLRMSLVDLRKHFDNLGCKFSRQNSILFATLPVPLKFPEVSRRRRR